MFPMRFSPFHVFLYSIFFNRSIERLHTHSEPEHPHFKENGENYDLLPETIIFPLGVKI